MAITDPRDIPGLLAWYSAEAETGYADGQEMTQWTDLSGNGNHALPGVAGVGPVWDSTDGPSGGPAVIFEGEFWKLPNGLLSGLTQGSAAVTLRARLNNQGFWSLSSSGNLSHFPYGSTVYDTFGVGFQETVVSISLDTWYRYMATAKTSEWKAYLDGSNVRTTTTNPVGFPTGTPYLGASQNDSWHFRGRMSFFAVYDHVLTATERADLDTWRAANPSGGTVAAAPPSGSLAVSLPVTTLAASGSYTPPTETGALAVTLPVPTVALSGTYLDPAAAPTGTLAAALPVPTIDLAGGYTAPAGDAGVLTVTLPVPTLALAGTYYGLGSYGLCLDSAVSVEVEPVLDVDADTVPLHVVVPTVPVPTLIAGRPQ